MKRQTERLAAGWEEGAVLVVGTLGDATGAGAGAQAGRAEAGGRDVGPCLLPACRLCEVMGLRCMVLLTLSL